MMNKSKIIILTISLCLLLFFSSCNDQPIVERPSAPEVVSGKIPPPVAQTQTLEAEKKIATPMKVMKPVEVDNTLQTQQEPVKDDEKMVYYDSQGKIDPFVPLIQEKPQESRPVIDDNPQRVLTPLEKIELNQIRLVAVVITESKRIAMVEEATGKGYEVIIGTYIGKNQGKVSEINDSSIMVTELVKDFKGKIKEHTQKIKLHKNDDEE